MKSAKEAVGIVFLMIATVLFSALLVFPPYATFASDPLFIFVYYILDIPEWWMCALIGAVLLKGGMEQRRLVTRLNELQKIPLEPN